MRVHVEMMPLLAKRARSHRERFDFTCETDCTPSVILDAEGFSEVDRYGIAAVVNGVQADHEQRLTDGNRVEFLIAIQGGSA